MKHIRPNLPALSGNHASTTELHFDFMEKLNFLIKVVKNLRKGAMKDRNMSDSQEKRWIDLARKDDRDAFNKLVLSYQDAAFNFASRMLNGDSFADDVVQAAFLTAYRNIKHLRGSSFHAWLLKIVRNLCIDELRRRHRHPSIPLEPMNDENQPCENTKWLIAPGFSPEEIVVEHEDCMVIEQAILQLPDRLREVLILVDVEELNYQDTATVLNVPCGTIKSRLSRARAHLRALLGEGFFDATIVDGSTFEYVGVSQYAANEIV